LFLKSIAKLFLYSEKKRDMVLAMPSPSQIAPCLFILERAMSASGHGLQSKSERLCPRSPRWGEREKREKRYGLKTQSFGKLWRDGRIIAHRSHDLISNQWLVNAKIFNKQYLLKF